MIRVVEEVRDPRGWSCAVWAARVYRSGDPFHAGACGRFLVEDDSGGILVDDDCFVLRDERWTTWPVVMRSGDRVEIVGRVSRMAPAAVALITPGLRHPGQTFSFDGTPEAPIVITVVGRGT